MGEDSCSNVESVDRNLEHVDNLKGSISLSFFLDGIQIAFSCILLLFSVALVAAAILPDKTSAWSTFRVPGGGSLVLFWLLVIWLAIVEGGQGALVGLMPVAKDKYRTTHRIAYTCTSVVHKDRSLDRFIVGRQFLVVLIIFLVNICGGFVAKGGPILGLPDTLLSIFLENGLAMMFITLNVGQLAAQLNSAGHMLDFIINRVMWVTMWLSFFVESSGGLHVIYLVQLAFPPPKNQAHRPRRRPLLYLMRSRL